MKTIHNKQFIPYLILLMLLTSNILKAQSIPDSTAKKYRICKVVYKLYWYNDTINPASIHTEYYNSKSRIDSVIYQNMKTNTISSQNYYTYNKKNILINQKSIMYYDTPSVIILKKSDIKKQKKKYKYDKKGRLIEIVTDPTSYLMKYTLTYDSLNNLVIESKYYRKDSTEERTISEYNAKNQLYKSTLILYKDGIKQGVLNTTFNFYNKNGLLEKSYNYNPGLDTPTSIDQYEYTFY